MDEQCKAVLDLLKENGSFDDLSRQVDEAFARDDDLRERLTAVLDATPSLALTPPEQRQAKSKEILATYHKTQTRMPLTGELPDNIRSTVETMRDKMETVIIQAMVQVKAGHSSKFHSKKTCSSAINSQPTKSATASLSPKPKHLAGRPEVSPKKLTQFDDFLETTLLLQHSSKRQKR
eukprot:gb/GEZN01013711.1/.p1 GENE.gb/GEZN01013711.1/~~gb/GEZN01013711.1/.p1  ORF type:complete len:178 (-),score=30.34 gb/GEZN01013711.1/:401-934(-)